MAIRFGDRTLNAREQAAKVREWAGWSKEEYRKQRDILYNRARAYEKATGMKKGTINVPDLLAREVRRRYFSRYYGEDSRPTNLYRAVMQAPAQSSGRAVSRTAASRVRQTAEAALRRQFRGLLRNSKYSADIQREYDNLVVSGEFTVAKFEELLKLYGQILNAEVLAQEQANLTLPWYLRQKPDTQGGEE